VLLPETVHRDEMGIKHDVKGMFWFGPPGCGTTLIAREQWGQAQQHSYIAESELMFL